MSDQALASLADYSRFVAELLDRPTVRNSTVSVWSDSPHTGTAEGEVFFTNGCRLRVRQELDFAARLITAYGYEIYSGAERLCWYDDFPHPHEASLAGTFPHHKHVPPDMKRHRIPAPEMSFARPNLPVVVRETESVSRDM